MSAVIARLVASARWARAVYYTKFRIDWYQIKGHFKSSNFEHVVLQTCKNVQTLILPQWSPFAASMRFALSQDWSCRAPVRQHSHITSVLLREWRHDAPFCWLRWISDINPLISIVPFVSYLAQFYPRYLDNGDSRQTATATSSSSSSVRSSAPFPSLS